MSRSAVLEGGAKNCLPEDTTEKLRLLAEKYENDSFTDGDPSFVLKRYTSPADIECGGFISAVLAFGRRDQFIPKIEKILSSADEAEGPARWLISGNFRNFAASAENQDAKFYRFYSYRDMDQVFERLAEVVKESGSLGSHMKQLYRKTGNNLLILLQEVFAGCRAVPQGKASAAKRLCMFMRWMVRQDSPVDTGLWNWYPTEELIIPLDTHVLQEAEKLGIIPKGSPASLKTARMITEKMKEVWPHDPCRADFALFGMGVDSLLH